MSSDYLKQLQLTKQLEQKAKELTRERRQAEARLSDVRKALDAAKGAGIDVTEPEATLTQASEAFTQRDNAKVLALADNCVGQLQELKRERLSSIVVGLMTWSVPSISATPGRGLPPATAPRCSPPRLG